MTTYRGADVVGRITYINTGELPAAFAKITVMKGSPEDYRRAA
jgi:hypothetical protein